MAEIARRRPGAAGLADGDASSCEPARGPSTSSSSRSRRSISCAQLEARGAHVYLPRGDQDYAIDVGLRMLTLRHLVVESDGLYARIRPSCRCWPIYVEGSIAICLGG